MPEVLYNLQPSCYVIDGNRIEGSLEIDKFFVEFSDRLLNS